MPVIKAFDRTNLRLLAADVSAALEPVAKKYGLSLTRGNGTFSPSNYRLRVEFNTVSKDEAGTAVKQEVADFQRSAHFYGLDPSDLGKMVNVYGKTYKIAGLLPNRRRYPILVETVRGRQVCIPAEPVVEALNRLKGLKTKDSIKSKATLVTPPSTPDGDDWKVKHGSDDGLPSIDELSSQLNAGHEKLAAMGFTGENNEDSRRELAGEASVS